MTKVILVLLALVMVMTGATLATAAPLAGNLIPNDNNQLIVDVSAGQVLKIMNSAKAELNGQVLVDEPGNVISLVTLPTDGQLTVNYPYGVCSLTYLYDKSASVGVFAPTIFTQTLTFKVYHGAELLFSTTIE